MQGEWDGVAAAEGFQPGWLLAELVSRALRVNRAAVFWGVSLEPGKKEDIQKVQIHHILYLYHDLAWNDGD